MVQCCWAPVNCKLSFVFLTNNGSSQCGPASVLHLLQGCVCILWLQWCVIWVTIAFLSDQSSLAIFLRPLVPTLALLHRQLPLTGYFLFYRPISANLGDAYMRKTQIFSSSNHLFPLFWYLNCTSAGQLDHIWRLKLLGLLSCDMIVNKQFSKCS